MSEKMSVIEIMYGFRVDPKVPGESGYLRLDTPPVKEEVSETQMQRLHAFADNAGILEDPEHFVFSYTKELETWNTPETQARTDFVAAICKDIFWGELIGKAAGGRIDFPIFRELHINVCK